MKPLTKDARRFIEGVTQYIRRGERAKTVLPKVQSLFAKVTAQARRSRVAEITSAVPLTNPEKSAIARALPKLLSHDVECQYAVDPDLLGGLTIQVADWVVDSSFRSQLATIAQSLERI